MPDSRQEICRSGLIQLYCDDDDDDNDDKMLMMTICICTVKRSSHALSEHIGTPFFILIPL